MLERAKQNPKITLVTNTVVDEILGTDVVTGVRLRNVKTNDATEKPVAGIFMGIGHQPNTALFAGQLELDENSYIKTRGRSTYTSVEGVFAAGDVQDHTYRQAITAAGSGCQAAIDVERWLQSQPN
jgi:thioredoxin reductase (NADPH)